MIFDFQYLLDFFSANGIIKSIEICTIRHRLLKVIMSKEKMTVARAMVKCLEAEGITKIFGYPGAAICPFYDEIYNSKIQHILVRHEANAGHAASGYARITGKPAVAVATSGPGATNLITAIATAYMDSIPIIFITGQVNSFQIGKDVFQEADITGAAEPFVKHSYLVKDADSVPRIFKEAFYLSQTGRPGPILIDMPFDIQKQEVAFKYPKSVDLRSYKPSTFGNKLQIKRVIEAIKNSKKPLICVGGGAFFSNSQDKLARFSSRCEIPVVSSLMGVSALPHTHPMNFGMLGMHGVRTANIAAKNCDLLILLGARVGDRAAAAIKESEDLKVVHIDIDPAEIGKNIDADVPVVGDLSLILDQILELAPELKHEEWVEKLNSFKIIEQCDYSDDGYVHPKLFINKLNEALPRNSIIVSDVGQNQIWTAANLHLDGGRFLTTGGMGTMGYSLPCAIGAKSADKKAEVIVICGDGSFQMMFMELATMIQHNIDVKIILMKNNKLGMVRELQTKGYGDRQIAVCLDGSPDFIQLAKAYGISAESINENSQVEGAIKSLIESKKPYVLQVIVDENQRTIIS